MLVCCRVESKSSPSKDNPPSNHPHSARVPVGHAFSFLLCSQQEKGAASNTKNKVCYVFSLSLSLSLSLFYYPMTRLSVLCVCVHFSAQASPQEAFPFRSVLPLGPIRAEISLFLFPPSPSFPTRLQAENSSPSLEREERKQPATTCLPRSLRSLSLYFLKPTNTTAPSHQPPNEQQARETG